ncbi:hypothetical protein RFI_22560 [Reticulomyxa filosa]|uniref:Uncharacterized protein n=1 Tax=Reticulomyxa filosa TaxID=46433 RepID=X6MLQ6_RETFI|nr:hypothetical protein RFI_22560 [Reticulomyxa filosa]|eukprot:ETO14804.1 hypothetical protein RFI_22560 [Reticulomyxa filosa]
MRIVTAKLIIKNINFFLYEDVILIDYVLAAMGQTIRASGELNKQKNYKQKGIKPQISEFAHGDHLRRDGNSHTILEFCQEVSNLSCILLITIFFFLTKKKSNEKNKLVTVMPFSKSELSLKIRIKKNDINFVPLAKAGFEQRKKRPLRELEGSLEYRQWEWQPLKKRTRQLSYDREINVHSQKIEERREDGNSKIGSFVSTCPRRINEKHDTSTSDFIFNSGATETEKVCQTVKKRDTKHHANTNNEEACDKCGVPWCQFRDVAAVAMHKDASHIYECAFPQCSLRFTHIKLLNEHEKALAISTLNPNSLICPVVVCDTNGMKQERRGER